MTIKLISTGDKNITNETCNIWYLYREKSPWEVTLTKAVHRPAFSCFLANQQRSVLSQTFWKKLPRLYTKHVMFFCHILSHVIFWSLSDSLVLFTWMTIDQLIVQGLSLWATPTLTLLRSRVLNARFRLLYFCSVTCSFFFSSTISFMAPHRDPQ